MLGSDPEDTLGKGELTKPLAASGSTIAVIIGIGTLSYHALEDWTWIQCLYFSVVSMTSVGYGDFVPTSEASRLFTVFYLLTGVGAVVASLGIIGSRYLERRDRKIRQKWDNRKPD